MKLEHQIELVYEKESKVVTDSIMIAAVFEKRHDKILRDIRNLKKQCPINFFSLNFAESHYINKQGRKMPLYIITENGFYLLAMGYTGERAMQFKIRYINEFQRMRTLLESRKKQLEIQMGQATALLESYEDKITILSKQQKEIQLAIRERIHTLYPNVSDKGRRKYFARIYQELKALFNVDSYRDIRQKDFDEALNFIKNWGLTKIGES